MISREMYGGAESLRCATETNTTLHIKWDVNKNIKNKNFIN